MEDRPLTSLQLAHVIYGAVCASRLISGMKIPPWEMLRDDQKIWFAGAVRTEERPQGQIAGLAPITERDEAIVSALRTALAGK